MIEAGRLISSWLVENEIEILNVAGARASKDPEIYEAVYRLLMVVLKGMA